MGSLAIPEASNVTFNPPEIQSLTGFVDEIASADPQRPWIISPTTDELSGSWRTITFAEFAQAINGAAKWIRDTIGVGKGERQSVAYMGVNDQRYLVMVLALMKTNRRAVLLSLRNSAEAQAHLLKSTTCTHSLYTEGIDPQLKILRNASGGIPEHQVPKFDEMLAIGRGQQSSVIGKEGMEETVVILHSSGSTGLPKPIPITAAWLASLYFQKYLNLPSDRQSSLDGIFRNDGEPLLIMAPLFHAMGLSCILRSLYTGPVVLAPASRRMDAGLTREVLSKRKASAAILPPSILDELTETEEGLAALSTLNHVSYGGAPLSRDAGDKIIGIAALHNVYGSTEAALISKLDPVDPKDWQWYEWHSSSGAYMEEADDGQYELIIKPSSEYPYRTVFYTFPGLEEWRTKDLWRPHPRKRGLWTYSGRRDDVIVFSNGEKFTPLLFEAAVESHPLVRGAVVVGQNRFQPGLIVEPHEFDDPDHVLEQIWPTVDKANQEAPAFAKVWKNKIAIGRESKPFPRAGKGSIQRHATVQLYEPEINALYSNESFSDELERLSRQANPFETRKFVRKALRLALPSLDDNITDDTNIFDQGVDSLSVLALTTTITHGLQSDDGSRNQPITLAPRDVYDNPTITMLASRIYSKMHRKDSVQEEVRSREEVMTDMIKKYTADMPKAAGTPMLESATDEVVILTGSTGSLGTYTLYELISSPAVTKVYCLNRSEGAESRQKSAFENAGLPVDFRKVTFLHTDFARAQFGLSDTVYNELLNAATTFIHNAWSVDFNHPLEGFEQTHIAGTRRVVDFSLASRFCAQIVFISSIASVANWPAIGSGPVPERFLEDNRAPLPQGYGESKHVASRILAYASQHGGIPVSIVRCGQLAGPRHESGVWNRHEWLPSIVHTSKSMGIVPRNLGNQDLIDWVPMDAAGRTVFEIATKRQTGHDDNLLDVFHVTNPRVVSWNSLIGTIQDFYSQQGKPLRDVSFDEWLAALKAVPLTKEEAVDKPGVKLIDFYEGLTHEGVALPEMSTKHTEEVSDCLHTLGPVSQELFTTWMKQWKF